MGFDESQQTDPLVVIRNGKRSYCRPLTGNLKNDWWRNLDGKGLYSLNSSYGSEHLLKSLLNKMKQYKVRGMADIVINRRVGTTKGHGGMDNRYDGIPFSWDEHAVTSCTGGLGGIDGRSLSRKGSRSCDANISKGMNCI